MRNFLTLVILLIAAEAAGQQPVTTFILMRHAEKASDGTKDPDLTDAGRERAIRLAGMLQKMKIDAIYSTPFKRTQQTVAPLALKKGLNVTSYEPLKGEAIDEMLKKYSGGTIVVCGHSNTTPWIANYLTGKNNYTDFEDSDYGNLLIVDVTEKGRVAKVTWLTY